MRKYVAQPALSHFLAEEVVLGAKYQTNEQISAAMDWLTSPGLHATGTCRMGTDEDSEVDSRLRVRGVGGLRVVDCSVMPLPPAGNTNGPAMVIGFRASELILEERDEIAK